MMNNEEKRIACPRCNGVGGTLSLKKVEGTKDSAQTLRVKETCPICWGRGYIDSAYVDVSQMEQNTKYFMYP